MVLNLVMVNITMNYIGATMTLNSSPYSITELLLLRQRPIASVARQLHTEYAEGIYSLKSSGERSLKVTGNGTIG